MMDFAATASATGGSLDAATRPASQNRQGAMQFVIAPPDTAVAAPAELPIERLKRVLQGRYRWALGMTLFGLVMGASAGWSALKPIYASVGVAQVHPVLPRVLYANEHSDVLPMFDSYMDSRVALITSRRVTELAMSSPEWTALRRDSLNASGFAQNITVDRAHGSELIEITYADPSPQVAMIGAHAVTDAFEKIFNEQDATSQQELFRVLEDRRTTLASQIGAARDRIASVAGELGAVGLQRMQDFKIDELQRMETKLHDLDIQLALGSVSPAGDDGDASNPRHDPTLAYLQQQQAQAQMQVDAFQSRLAASHPSVITAKALLEQIAKRVAERQAQTGSRAYPVIGGADVAELNQHAQMQKLYDQLKADMLQNGAKLMQIEKLGNELKTEEQKLDETRSRIEQLNVESMIGGRLSIISRGDLSEKPFKDKRKQTAIMLGLVLGGLGFSAVLLVGMLDRRLRYAADARAGGRALRVLGVLPELSLDLSDPLQSHAAATEVHHIRTLLQVQRSGESHHKVIAITGPSRAAGKTSLTLAVGLSFAASGYRTLLIDGDLCGRGLTRRLGIVSRRKLGQILIQTGIATSEQIDEALHRANADCVRIGEALLAMQLVNSDELQFLLRRQLDESLGLTDALRGYDVQTCISQSRFNNCSVLPCCRVGEADQTCVSPDAVNKLLAKVRNDYDVILIDTGPVLGNAESAVMNASADAVVLAVSRGQIRSEMERAVAVIESLHVPLIGAVFNRAGPRDLRGSVGSYYSNSSTEPGGRRKDEKVLLHALIGGDPVLVP